jgi:nucleoside-diphosphate-sugar epimerase
MSPRSVLVTGAAGGVGHRVCRVLRGQGFQVRGLVRPEDDVRRLDLRAEDIRVGYVQDPATMRQAMRGVDTVVHCAALLPNALDLGPEKFQEVNVEGTRNAMRHAMTSGITNFVAMSTISVVDHVTRTITPDDLFDYVSPPSDAYLASKIAAEKMLLEMRREFAGELAILRLAYVYGPGNFVVWRQPLGLLEQGKLRLIGHRATPLPLIYADDIGRFVSALLNGRAPHKEHGIHVIANPEPTTLRGTFEFAADYLGVPPPGSVPLWAARLGATLMSAVPQRYRRGRLDLLTRARVSQFSRGYDLSGVLDTRMLEEIELTDSEHGLEQMLADYVATERAPERS